MGIGKVRIGTTKGFGLIIHHGHKAFLVAADMGSNDIQTILSQITALVTDAVLRATAQKKDEDDAA
jgi:hypothetical protein